MFAQLAYFILFGLVLGSALMVVFSRHAVHSARGDAVEHGVSANATSALADGGFPVLWSITWRTRSASWMLRNRGILEAAL